MQRYRHMGDVHFLTFTNPEKPLDIIERKHEWAKALRRALSLLAGFHEWATESPI